MIFILQKPFFKGFFNAIRFINDLTGGFELIIFSLNKITERVL